MFIALISAMAPNSNLIKIKFGKTAPNSNLIIQICYKFVKFPNFPIENGVVLIWFIPNDPKMF